METYKNLFEQGINLRISQNSSVKLHKHDFFELAYVLSGKAQHILNGEERTIAEGEYLIMDYDACHHYIVDETKNFEILNCLFFGEFIDLALKNKRDFSDVVNSYMLKYNFTATNLNPANRFFKDESGEVLSLLQAMLKEQNQKAPGYLEILRVKLIEIIILTMRKDNAILPDTEDSLCLEIMKYTEKNLRDKTHLSALSKKLCYSTAYLSKRFKKETGISFSAYVQKIRIEQALRLLTETNKKVTEIASECGYADTKFFNAVFKKHTGFTPREYRKQK
ncbi:MAG: helix-turn-helix domain-containing protein [Clostridia bacterium]|nr:helix-turn-helix domain-containing protein [Clostridia bacterium]